MLITIVIQIFIVFTVAVNVNASSLCPDGTKAVGGCIQGYCGDGYTCKGDLCCRSAPRGLNSVDQIRQKRQLTLRCNDGTAVVSGCFFNGITSFCNFGLRCDTSTVRPGYCCSNTGTVVGTLTTCPNGAFTFGTCPGGAGCSQLGTICVANSVCCSRTNACPNNQATTGFCVAGCTTGYTCVNNICCPSGTVTGNVCPSGVTSGICVAGICPTGQFCLNGAICCTTTTTTLATCPSGLTFGTCPGGAGCSQAGTICVGNSVCCSRTNACAGNLATTGFCTNNVCTTGYACVNNICCPSGTITGTGVGSCFNGASLGTCVGGICPTGQVCVGTVCCANPCSSSGGIDLGPCTTGTFCPQSAACINNRCCRTSFGK